MTPGVYNFDGQLDIFEFIEMAQKIGFVVIFRVGPYACGEHDYGGIYYQIFFSIITNH